MQTPGAEHLSIDRRLQIAFRNELGMSPAAFLKLAALQRAHRDLVEADATSTQVSAIAARHGFHHSGRFAAYYRAVYGRRPGDTLSARSRRSVQ